MSPSANVWVPILVAIVTGLVTVVTVFVTGRANLRLERERFINSSRLENQKFDSSLILQVIGTGLGENEAALKNLRFLVKMGFLTHLKDAIEALEPEETGVLPARAPVEPPQPRTGPALYRWPVRTGTDLDASLVEARPIPATVEELVAQSRPRALSPATDRFPAYQTRRAEGAERTVYVVEATIVGCHWMQSQMFHLDLRGDSGQTMIANCPHPDPRFVEPGSRWVEQISQARLEIQEKLKPIPGKWMSINERARVTGVGFFNHVHRQRSMAPNGLELSPVLRVEWLS